MHRIGVGTFKTNRDMVKDVSHVLESGRISYGPYCKRFEREFAAAHDCEFGVLSNSGTSSLHVALQTLKELHGWRDGDEVLIPASTFVATANIVIHNRMTPVLVDVESGLWAMNPHLIGDHVTSRTRAIIPVHPFGQPANMYEIARLAHHYDLKVIEDSCECVGVSHYGKKVGNWSDISCFSFYVAHVISTGVGGMSLTSNPDYAAYMRSLVNHGRDNIYISMDDNDRLEEVIGKRFSFPRIGHSFRITELEAAIGLNQLGRLRHILMKRVSNATYLSQGLPYILESMMCRPLTERAWMMFPLFAHNNDKQGLCTYLESHGIETRDALPLTNQPAYNFREGDFPVAMSLNRKGFYVGCHQGLALTDMQYIIDVLGAYDK